MPDTIKPVAISPRQKIGWREWATLVVLIIFGLGVWRVDEDTLAARHVAQAAQQAAVANRQIGYRNRAAICDFVREFGGVEPSTCRDPALGPYRDSQIVAGSGERRATTNLLCLILTTLKQSAPQCQGGA